MKTSAPALVPFLRSDAQARLLAALMLRPEREATLTELALEMGVNTSSAYREVERMVGSGVLADRTLGRTRLVRADLSYRYFEPLAQILAGSYGPVEAIRSALDGIEGVQDAMIFGSYAARFLGHAGPSPVTSTSWSSGLRQAARSAAQPPSPRSRSGCRSRSPC